MTLELIEVCRRFGHKSRIYARLTFAIFNPIMLAMFTRLSISYDYKMISVAQDDLLMVDSMYVYVSNMITVVLLATICKNCLKDREKRNSQKMVLREIDEFYRVIKSNSRPNMKNLAQNIKFISIGKVSFTSDIAIPRSTLWPRIRDRSR